MLKLAGADRIVRAPHTGPRPRLGAAFAVANSLDNNFLAECEQGLARSMLSRKSPPDRGNLVGQLMSIPMGISANYQFDIMHIVASMATCMDGSAGAFAKRHPFQAQLLSDMALQFLQ